MSQTFKDNGYLIIPKILSGELLDFIGIHAYNKARIDGTISADDQIPNTPAFYGDYTMENLSKLLDLRGQSTLLLIIILNLEMLIRLEVEILMLGGLLGFIYGIF